MAFKQSPNKKARLEDLSKAALIKTVRTLQRRETKLLNQVAALEKAQDKLAGAVAEAQGGQADRLLVNLRPAVEFGYRAGEKGVDNLQVTLSKWGRPPVQTEGFAHSGDGGGAIQREASETPARFPWEE